MRQLITLVLLLTVACKSAAPVPELSQGEVIGEPMIAQEIVAFATVDQGPADYFERTVLVDATVQAVCQRAGCWMQLEDDGRTAMVRWETGCGGKYTFPEAAIGQRVIVQGSFYPKTIEPDDADHLHEEAGGELEVALDGYEFNASAVLIKP
ncbi:MAG: hypothetical protein ACI8QZ_003742 [Chlamydiales bacterium]